VLRWIRSHGVHQREISLSYVLDERFLLLFVYRQILHDAIRFLVYYRIGVDGKKDTVNLNSVQVTWL
jgi:hypothetical protein